MLRQLNKFLKLFSFVIILFSALKVSAKPIGASFLNQAVDKPVVRYSDVWAGDFNATLTGYFDVTYLNAVIPFGSTVIVHYGFDYGVWNSYTQRYELSSRWIDMASIEMKQWEEYGWFTRVPKMIRTKGAQFSVIGFDFYLEIRKPDGSIEYNRGGMNGANFYSGQIPDMQSCNDMGHEYLKICAVPLDILAVRP